MKWVILSIAALSAVCECYGTYTVWRNYTLSSWAAQKVCESFEAMQEADDRFFGDPSNLTFYDAQITGEPHEVYHQRTFTRSGILTIASSLRPTLRTQIGLAAYIAGAVFGLIAVALALLPL
jgi:hypothetical protein